MSAARLPIAVRVLAPLAMMGAIFYFSAQPFDGPELAWWELAIRKLGHVTGYAVLTGLWWWALLARVRRPLLAAAAISFAYACTDEYHQTFVDGRYGSPADIAIDSIGIAIASLAIHLRWPRPAERAPAAETAG